jgi:hypothetical protein
MGAADSAEVPLAATVYDKTSVKLGDLSATVYLTSVITSAWKSNELSPAIQCSILIRAEKKGVGRVPARRF